MIYEWQTTRAASCLEHLISIEFAGTVQCDGYSAYDRFASRREEEGQPVVLAGCWAHVRRGFFEAMDSAPKEAAWILVQIGHLYRIEAELRKQGAGVALRDAYRSSQSRPVIRRIQQALERWQSTRASCLRAASAKRSVMPWVNGNRLEVYHQTLKLKSTIIRLSGARYNAIAFLGQRRGARRLEIILRVVAA